MDFIHYISEWNSTSIIVRLVLSTLFGSLIGLERSAQKHSTGTRTFALVCLGSALATMMNIYLVTMNGHSFSADVSRIPAAVVSGIGFLGAGSILVTGHNQIRGLTTAASLWVTAIMGIALGAGFISTSCICFLLILLANTVLLKASKFFEDHTKLISLYIELDNSKGIQKLRKQLIEDGYHILSITKSKQKPLNDTDVVIVVELDLGKKQGHRYVLNQLYALDYINYLEEI